MQVIENNALFTQVAAEESSIASGGGPVAYLQYIQLAQTPASPGGTQVNAGEIQYGWDILVNAAAAVNAIASL
ncbi:hypothetical protein ACSQ6I_16440 [Anabaena sp. WFMT]|uniref:hypothetical protein n=1 Tax=Anabaena sp. WFMT TaxID=3449730 RepID=UPI003F28061E